MFDIFKPITHNDEEITYFVPKQELWPPKKINRSFEQPSELLMKNDEIKISSCLKCHPAKCVTYVNEELSLSEKYNEIPTYKNKQVCPTHAITKSNSQNPIIDMDLCVQCQLCIIRCPIGALYWDDEEIICAEQNTEDWSNENTTNKDQSKIIFDEILEKLNHKNAEVNWSISHDFIVPQLESFQNKIYNLNINGSQGLKKEEYYPLVTNYFRELHLKAVTGKIGDQNWRIDGTVLLPFIMPIEIKSPTEAKKIGVGSARQAFENAAVIESHNFAINPPSIVVGYQLPNDRSLVRDTVYNMHTSFGPVIGLYTTAILLYLLLRSLEYRFHPINDIKTLFTTNIGVCDENSLKQFWANYITQRLEIKVIGEASQYYDTLINYFPQENDYNNISENLLLQKWSSEIELLSDLEDALFDVK